MVFYNMHDGRAFTHYEPNCALNAHLSKNNKSANTHEYRKYLQQNAIKLMKEMAMCVPVNEKTDCKICPVCSKAIDYKPDGNMPSGPVISTIATNVNPYNSNPLV